MRACLRALAVTTVALCIAGEGRGTAQAREPEAGSGPGAPLSRGLALFKERKYEQAIPLLEAALRDPELREEAVLLLGICRYRTGDLTRAETHLREAAKSQDAELRDSAQLFLGLVFEEAGAVDQASTELGRVTRSQTLGTSAQRLLRQRRPNRLLISFLVAPEYDSNVLLKDFATWRSDPRSSGDFDVLFLGSVSVRPFRFGLSLGNTISYRQQITLRSYSLLLNSTWLGYSHAGADNRVRVTATLGFTLLGGSPLYLDGDGRAYYWRRIRSRLGISAAYDLRHRRYFSSDDAVISGQNPYQPLNGQTHTGQIELSWGTVQEPLLLGLGYQVLRDQLQTPEPPLLPSEDYRAWAHGPTLRGRVRLHPRVELGLNGAFLERRFDYVPPPKDTNLVRRIDYMVSAELSLTVRFAEYFEAFAGGTVLYNFSTQAPFHYLKPATYFGIAGYFGLL